MPAYLLQKIIFLSGLIFSLTTFAEVAFIPRVEMGQAEYSIDFSGLIPLPDGTVQYDRNYFSLDPLVFRLGGTLSYEKYFFDVYYQTSSEDTSVQLFPRFGVIESWRAKKNDYNLAIGMAAVRNLYLFGGYRDLKQTADGAQNSEYEFRHSGFFIGGSYAWNLTDTGSLSVNLGYAWLEADISESLFGIKVPSASGKNGNGIKYGVIWRDQLSETISYSLSFDSYRYDHHLLNREQGVDVDIQEEETSVRIGISRLF